MVDEKTSTRALTGRRRMSIPMQPIFADYDPLTARYVKDQGASATWIEMGVPGFYQEHYYDISGYTNDDLTTMPVNAYVQEAGRVNVTAPGSIRLVVMDIVMEQRIPDVTIMVQEMLATNSGIPGSLNSNTDWQQIQYLRFREFTGLTQGTTVADVFTEVRDSQFGSMEPTTADKLWVYKIVSVIGIPSSDFSSLRYPSSRMVMDIDVVQEDDIPYLMRLKRSYELTNYE